MNILDLMQIDEAKPSLEQLAQRAAEVTELSQGRAFKWLVADAARSAVADMAAGKTWQEREAAHQRIMGIRSLETEIQKIVDRGAQAAAQLKKRQPAQSDN